MKKVLTLLALLMTTVAAMATGYTGPLTYTLFGSTEHAVASDENVIIESTGDNQYTVTLKGCDFSAELGYSDYNFGTLTFSGLTGTTEDGVTTINASDPTSKFSANPLMKCQDGDLLVRFNDEKAFVSYDGKLYMGYGFSSYTFTIDFGTNDFTTGGGGETPVEPTEQTLWENYQADGNGFSQTVNIDWDTQKIVASIDFSNGGDDKDILAMTTGSSFSNFQVSDYRTMHWYCNQSAKQVSGFFALAGSGNNNTGRIDVTDCLAKFEITKANGLTLNGATTMSASVLEDLFASNTLLIGSGESPKFSKAYYNYVKIVPLDWTEPSAPDTKEFPTPADDAKQFSDNLQAIAGGYDMGTAAATAYVSYGDGTADIQIDKVAFGADKKINIAGVKVAEENGFTVFSGDDLVLLDEDCNEFKAAVNGKAKDNKLYLEISTNDEIFGWGGANFVFGDDNFNTGGGETPVEPTEITLKENYVADGNGFAVDGDIDWTTQKVVASIDLSTCKNQKAANELVFAAGPENIGWDYSVFAFYNKNKTLQCYTPGGRGNSGQFAVDPTATLRIELSKANGYVVNGESKFAGDDSKLESIFALNHIYVGDEKGNQASNATYNYIKIVPLDWTENPETPFEPQTFTTTGAANTTYGGTTTNYDEKTVEISEYEEDKFKITFKGLAVGSNLLGDFTIDNVSAETVDGVTTFTTTDTEGTWSNKNESAIISYLIPDATSAFSDFAASCTLTDEGQIDKLNLKFNLTIATGVANVVFGEKAEISQSYTATFYAVNKGTGESQEINAAKVTVVDKNDGTYQITLPSFDDPDGDEVPAITFLANGTTVDGTTTFTAENVEVALSGAWDGYSANIVSMNGTLAYNQLTATVVVELGGLGDDYTYTLGFGVKPFTPTTQTVTDYATIKIGDKTENFENATLDITENPEDVYAVTYKNFTVNGNEIGDLTIKDVISTVDESTGVGTLSTSSTVATWTRVVENNAAGFNAGDEVPLRNFAGTYTPASNGGGTIIPGGESGGVVAADETDEEGTLLVKFGVQLTGEWADVTFGEKPAPEEPIEGTVVEGSKDFAANGDKFEWTNIPINWDKQKLVAVFDLSSCTGTNENILSVGEDVSAWKIGGWHWYYTPSSTRLKTDYLETGGSHPISDEKTNVEATTLRIELSKANGCTVNGEDANGLYPGKTGEWSALTEAFWNTTSVNIGSKEGANRSHAVIKYVSVVDLPAQPEATTYDGQLQIIDGMTEDDVVKMDEAQVVITKNADGQTGSICFKNVTFGEQTGDLTFVGTLVESTEDGESFVTMQDGTSDEATTTLLGKEVMFGGSGQYLEGGDIQMTFEFYSEDESLYYVGQFGKGLWTAISGINADAAAGNTQIFTVNGTRVNALQKGINIVRTADGKTVKVLK